MNWMQRIALGTGATVVVAGAVGGLGYAVATSNGSSPSSAAPRVDRTFTPIPSPTASPTASPTPSPVPAAPTSIAPTPTAEPTPPPAPAPPRFVLSAGDRGEQVRELQARLFQLAWLPETTTGEYDATTVTAVTGFQDKHGFKPTGKLDRPTWRRIKSMSKQPTHDQMFNVLHPGPPILSAGDEGDDVRNAQARLKAISWIFGDVTGVYDTTTVEAVKGFQAKREIPVTGEIDQRTLDRLHSMTYEPSYDAMHNIEPQPGALDERCKTGRALCIDKTSRTLRWVIDGKVIKTLDARFGSTLNDTPTREGLFSVYLMDIDHVSSLYDSAMPFSMFFSGGQAVHYSSDFASAGYGGASHGCVNIRDYDGLAWLYSQVRIGDKVVVYWS